VEEKMSYKGKKKSPYGNPNRRNRASKPFRMKKIRKKEVFGLPISKDTEITECTHLPCEINEEGKTSLGVNLGNQVGNIGFSGTKEKKRSTKFNDRVSKKSTNKKRAYI
jgi:hypothetical protein